MSEAGLKVYEGAGSLTVTVKSESGSRRLDPRLDLRNHSPDGFNWGYAGSGPAQLALALCADALGDDRRAVRVYQRFKFMAVARLSKDEGWVMTSDEVVALVERIESNDVRDDVG